MKIALCCLIAFIAGFIVASEGAGVLYRDRAKNGFIVIDDKAYRVSPTPME